MGAWGTALEHSYRLLLATTLGLSLAVVGLIVFASVLQVLADRRNHHRIACFRRWENSVPLFIFRQGPPPEDIRNLTEEQKEYFRMFLQRLHVSLGGPDAVRLTELYFLARLDERLEERLQSRSPRHRALAAMEVWAFELWRHLPQVLPLLSDERPFVAFAAAKALAKSRNLDMAPALLRWILGQDQYQRERVMITLEQFGPELLPWMESFLLPPHLDQDGWLLYALLAGSHRYAPALPRLLALLSEPDLELRCAAIKALQGLGDPTAFAKMQACSESEEVPVRLRATAALATLGGPAAIPTLRLRMTDPVFEIRRQAGMGLATLGPEGVMALTEIAADAESDAFARDMAVERLAWVSSRGRA